MFERYISIDWAGGGAEDQPVNLRLVEATSQNSNGTIVNPPRDPSNTRRKVKRWARAECRRWLTQILKADEPRCLIAMDFGFGYPWGADRSVFGCEGWEQMLGVLSRLYDEEGTAKLVAQRVNASPKFGGHGPYRFNHNRTDFRFYLDTGTPYYRLVEVAIPQAISQWYLGAGPTVGFGSITGMSTLHHLMSLREQGQIDFQVWPQECEIPDEERHVLVESYPAIYAPPSDYDGCNDEHCRDAWKVLQWMLGEANAGTLERHFEVTPKPFGRIVDVSFEDQIRFEGWIFGVSSMEPWS